MKNSKRIVLVALVLAGGLFGAASWYQGTRVKVCHTPYGDPMNTHTLELPEQGVQGHLDHGDYMGECKCNPNSNHE